MTSALIVSGFLGSGKTSLVRWLLADAQRSGERVAVISNEFGALGIDQAILGAGGDTLVELEGGCVCCQLSNELIDTLEMLRREVNPERIIIETSGIALPGQTQVHLWREPVKSWIEDDVAVVVINAEQVLEERELGGTFEYQLTSADLLILNKLDLVAESALPAIEARVRAIEPEAPLVHTIHGQIDPSVLFPPGAEEFRRRRRMNGGGQSAPHTHDHFTSEIIAVEAGIDETALIQRIRSLDALRVKGFVDTAGGPRLLQAVGARVQLHAIQTSPDLGMLGKVVVIRRLGG